MASTAQSVPNLSAFSSGELNALLAAVKAEVLTRIAGRVNTGASTGQSFGVNLLTSDELFRLNNALVAALGLDSEEIRVRPCFSRQGVGSDASTL